MSHTKEERATALRNACAMVVDTFISFEFRTSASSPNLDKVFGCFYLEYCDAICEGDGNRLLRCWKYMLPAFRSSRRKNYAVECLNMLCQVSYSLTPRQSAELLWSRFVTPMGYQEGIFQEIYI